MDRIQKQKVLELAKRNKVRFIRFWFSDILGFLKSFAITIDEFEAALDEGMGFDGVTVSSHRDYMEYENFVGKIKDLETL